MIALFLPLWYIGSMNKTLSARFLGAAAISLLAVAALTGCSVSATTETDSTESPGTVETLPATPPLPAPVITLFDNGWSDGTEYGDTEGAVYSRGFTRLTPDGSEVFCFSVWTHENIPDSWHCVPQEKKAPR